MSSNRYLESLTTVLQHFSLDSIQCSNAIERGYHPVEATSKGIIKIIAINKTIFV